MSAHPIHVLERDQAVIGGTRFLGATLWPDFSLHGQRSRSMEAVRQFGDYRFVRSGPSGTEAGLRLLTPELTLEISRTTTRWFYQALAEPHDGPTVVVTHFAPHPRSLRPEMLASPSAPAFCSDLSDVMAAGYPALWVHGHLHNPSDFHEGMTRIVCNPRGYATETECRASFNPALVIEF